MNTSTAVLLIQPTAAQYFLTAPHTVGIKSLDRETDSHSYPLLFTFSLYAVKAIRYPHALSLPAHPALIGYSCAQAIISAQLVLSPASSPVAPVARSSFRHHGTTALGVLEHCGHPQLAAYSYSCAQSYLSFPATQLVLSPSSSPVAPVARFAHFTTSQS